MCANRNILFILKLVYIATAMLLEDQLLFFIFLLNNEIDETVKVKGGENVFHETSITFI
jgi:hypothetical protein